MKNLLPVTSGARERRSNRVVTSEFSIVKNERIFTFGKSFQVLGFEKAPEAFLSQISIPTRRSGTLPREIGTPLLTKPLGQMGPYLSERPLRGLTLRGGFRISTWGPRYGSGPEVSRGSLGGQKIVSRTGSHITK